MSILIAGATPAEGFELKSCRFNNDSYLRRTFVHAGNQKTWTYSCWVKRSDLSEAVQMFATDYSDSNNYMNYKLRENHGDVDKTHVLEIVARVSSTNYILTSTQVFRDVASWMHIMLAVDTTQATAANRLRVYINGEEITTWQVDNRGSISQNVDLPINRAGVHDIGGWNNSGDFDGYISESYFIDGIQLLPSHFAETNELTNQWQPKDPADLKEATTFGLNGFYLPFSNGALNNSFTDANYHTPHTSITAVGTAHTDTGVKKFGTASLQLDGDSDYLRVPDHSDWTLGTSDFTIEAWVYNTTASGTQRLFGHSSHSVNGKKGWNCYLTSNTSGRFTWSTTGSDEESWTFANCMTQNTWTHFALTRTGTTMRVFKNGVMVDSTVDSDMTTIWNSPRDLLIGVHEENDSSLSGYFAGYIDEVRISDIVRYGHQGFTVATAAHTADKDTKLLLHMDGSNDGTSFTDSSWTGVGGKGHALVAAADVKNEGVSHTNLLVHEDSTGGAHFIGPKFGTGCGGFPITDTDYLEVPDSTDWDCSSGAYTIEAWVNFDDIDAIRTIVCHGGTGSSSDKNGWNLRYDSAERNISFAPRLDSNELETAADLIWPHRWYHIAVDRNGAATTIYIDGVSKASGNVTVVDAPAGTALKIGGDSDNGRTLKGYIDELRISNTRRYTEAFTPPTSAFTTDANTKLLLHMDGTMGDTDFLDSGSSTRSAISVGGNTHTDTSQKKIGTASAQFDGTGDYLVLPSTWGNCFVAGSGDWTVEAWVYWNGSADAVFLEQGNSADRAIQFYIQADGDIQIYLSTSGSSWNFNQVSGSTLSANTWTHIALVKYGSGIYLFKDGVLDGNINGDTQAVINKSDYVFNIGAYMNSSNVYSSSWPGYMDEIRFSNVARYTATFTAFGQSGGTISSPTAFTADDNTTLLLHCDGADSGTTFTDSVTGHPIHHNGSARIIAPKSGTGCYRNNGSGCGLEMARMETTWATFETGNSFTVEAWVCLDNVGTNNQQFFTHRWGVNAGDWVFWYDTTIGLVWSGDNNTMSQGNTTGWTSNTWHHIAVTRLGGTRRMFLDGSLIQTSTTDIEYDAWAQLFIMSYGHSSGFQSSGAATGFMDSARITNDCKYIDNFTPPTTPFTDDAKTNLILHMDGGINIDPTTGLGTGAGEGQYVYNAASNALFYGADNLPLESAKSFITFDGTGDTIYAPPSSEWEHGTSNFTWEAYVKLGADHDAGNLEGIIVNGSSGSAYNGLVYYGNVYSKQGLSWYQKAGGGSELWDMVENNGNVGSWNREVWTHVAIVRDSVGSVSNSRNFTLWKDGIPLVSETHSNALQTGFGNMNIGSYDSSTLRNWTGDMDDIRVSDTARYSKNFTPSTTQFDNDSDTILLLHCDGSDGATSFADSSTVGHSISAVGGANTDTGIKKIGTASAQFDGSGAYLSVPDHADWDKITRGRNWTIEFWIYPTQNESASTAIINHAAGGGHGWNINWAGSGNIRIYNANDGSGGVTSTTAVSNNAWTHVAFQYNSVNRFLRVYLNGNLDNTALNTVSWTAPGAYAMYIGAQDTGSLIREFTGQMDEIRISTVERYGNFTPHTTPFTADTNTKLLVQSDYDLGGLGADHSSNGNHFTSTNLTVDDMMPDTPMNSFCTVNPLSFGRHGNTTALWGKAKEGNLRWTSVGGQWGGHTYYSSTMAIEPNTGKWYWEMCDIGNAGIGTHSNFCWGVGMMVTDAGPNAEGHLGMNNNPGSSTGAWYIKSAHNVGTVRNYGGGASSENRPCPTSGTGAHVYKFAYDSDTGLLYFGGDLGWTAHDTTSTGAIITSDFPSSSQYLFTGLNAYTVTPCYHAYQATTLADNMQNFGQDASFAGQVKGIPEYAQDANDIGEFYFTPPAGYKALCTANLPDPSIKISTEHFNVALHAGNDTNRSITGLGFQPDVIWGKSRTNTLGHYIVDSVRGVNKLIYPDGLGSQDTDATIYTAFGADGFSLGTGDMNNASQNYVNWAWKAGGAPTATNSAGAGNTPTAGSVKIDGANLGTSLSGSIPVTKMSVNTAAGYSVLSYDGTASAGTIAHGLSATPAVVITKELSNNNDWFMYHRLMDGSGGNPHGYYMQPNLEIAKTASSTLWNNTAPTSAVFSVATDSGSNSSGRNYVAYCFQEIDGYSKFDAYDGNGHVDGPFVYCGFKPALVWIKRTSSNQDWLMWDTTRSTYNLTNSTLYGGSNYAEATQLSKAIDILSNGFKVNNTYDVDNTTNALTIYMAFAESPFKYADAR